jgi:hypothetical protein
MTRIDPEIDQRSCCEAPSSGQSTFVRKQGQRSSCEAPSSGRASFVRKQRGTNEEIVDGSWVKAKYPGNKWYPAQIESILSDGKFLLRWYDSDQNHRIKSMDEIFLLREAQGKDTKYCVGQNIDAKFLDNTWKPGVIEKCFESEFYLVRWDDDEPNGRVASAAYIKPRPSDNPEELPFHEDPPGPALSSVGSAGSLRISISPLAVLGSGSHPT